MFERPVQSLNAEIVDGKLQRCVCEYGRWSRAVHLPVVSKEGLRGPKKNSLFQTLAILERPAVNGRNAVGNEDALKATASGKGFVADRDDTVGNGDALQVPATRERIGLDRGDVFGESDV